MRLPEFAPNRRAHVVRATAGIVLLLGYGDLLRGGTTVAPVLLAIGYMILLPAAILAWH